VTGIVGVNGSGKSTLIRILATLIVPDTGTVRIYGHDIARDAHLVRSHINRVSVDAAFFKMLSPWENLVYAARIYGASDGARPRTEEILSRLGLPRESLDSPLKQLSRGQQQKVAIARSFLTTPSLLLMDEPTTGLDPHSKRDVQDFVRELRRDHDLTVVLCTHDLAEAQALCDRVVVLDGGRVVADGSPEELLQRHAAATLEEVFLAITGRRLDDDPDEEGSE
jgi:ABC-2 type transport system ATP-binding protein